MSTLATNPTLKEINALKKKLCWGDVPAIYHMVSSSLSELDGILTHGFDSAYKQILNPNTWNLSALDGHIDLENQVHVNIKPQISLQHHYNDLGYELHCYPMVDGERVNRILVDDIDCPFKSWLPESMRMLFRINSLVAFSIFAYQRGDEADIALIKYAYFRVNKLITILSESFDILSVQGYNIAEFYQEIDRRNGDVLSNDDIQDSSPS
jgi:hypothetical protein